MVVDAINSSKEGVAIVTAVVNAAVIAMDRVAMIAIAVTAAIKISSNSSRAVVRTRIPKIGFIRIGVS